MEYSKWFKNIKDYSWSMRGARGQGSRLAGLKGAGLEAPSWKMRWATACAPRHNIALIACTLSTHEMVLLYTACAYEMIKPFRLLGIYRCLVRFDFGCQGDWLPTASTLWLSDSMVRGVKARQASCPDLWAIASLDLSESGRFP